MPPYDDLEPNLSRPEAGSPVRRRGLRLAPDALVFTTHPTSANLTALRFVIHDFAQVRGEHLRVLLDLIAGVPWAIVSPWSSTWMSSHTPITTCMLCSTRITVIELVSQPADLLLQPFGLAVVHPRGGLVEQQQLRLRASSRGRSPGVAGCRTRVR
jgi:hypothetical protein